MGDIDVAGAVQETLRVAILQALGETDKLVGALVERMLSEKVTDPEHQYGAKINMIDLLIKGAISNAATTAVEEYLSEKTEELRAAVVASLRERTPELADALVNGAVKAAGAMWGVQIAVELKGKESKED